MRQHEKRRLLAATRKPLKRAVGFLTLAPVLCGAGCASAPSLDSAKLIAVSAATPTDIAREAQAGREWWKSLFRGGSIRDPQQGLLTFKTDEYDAFEAEEKRLPGLTSAEAGRRSSTPAWPVLRIEFALSSLPVAPGSTGEPAEVRLYLCDSESPRKDYFGWSNILWRVLYVTADNANKIQREIELSGQPQDYEVILRYVHYQWSGHPANVVTVIPPRDDLCLARYQINWPFTAIVRPLRLRKETVEAALATLPRKVRIDP